MVFMGVQINSKKVEMRLQQKENDAPNMLSKVNLQIALPMFRNLRLTAPVFRGYLRKDMMMEAYTLGKSAMTWIRFPTRDPDRGHAYSYYAEFGRASISGKTKPKMRFYKDPKKMGAGTYIIGNPNLIFRSRVGRAEPSFFITNTMKEFKPMARGVASKVVAEWLAL